MSPSDISPWLVLVSLAISIGGSVYAWLTARSRVNEKQISALSEKSSEHDRRLDKIENDMRHLPDQGVTQRMEISLAEMSGKIAVLSERLQPVAQISARLQEFMLERSK